MMRFNQLPLPAGICGIMTTRQGGCSLPPWDSFNLGDHVSDDPAHVRANRALLARTLEVRPVFLQQVHGWQVHELTAGVPDGMQADACFTFESGLACTIMVADCLPVLLWDTQGRWVAAAHAGWRGLAGTEGRGVLEALWAALAGRGAETAHTAAWLGPCIGPQAFEVGPEVRAAFADLGDMSSQAFTAGPGDRLLADLPALARARLARLGLTTVSGNDGTSDWCTVSRPALFFSHRRDARTLGSTGRMAACIWRESI